MYISIPFLKHVHCVSNKKFLWPNSWWKYCYVLLVIFLYHRINIRILGLLISLWLYINGSSEFVQKLVQRWDITRQAFALSGLHDNQASVTGRVKRVTCMGFDRKAESKAGHLEMGCVFLCRLNFFYLGASASGQRRTAGRLGQLCCHGDHQ